MTRTRLSNLLCVHSPVTFSPCDFCPPAEVIHPPLTQRPRSLTNYLALLPLLFTACNGTGLLNLPPGLCSKFTIYVCGYDIFIVLASAAYFLFSEARASRTCNMKATQVYRNYECKPRLGRDHGPGKGSRGTHKDETLKPRLEPRTQFLVLTRALNRVTGILAAQLIHTCG
ncbi:hypothetical protein BJV78DRAFT_827801 [Lactifluus subvellereus]|nr:hypothetical protein BJV78DRAFT_827801 [Lactifluus subvellereus]